MRIKALLDEDVVNYKKTSMFIATCMCDWKCCLEIGQDICLCQNSPIAKQKTIDYSNEKIIKRYLKNKLTSAIVIAGLEPFKQFDEVLQLIKDFRDKTQDDIVIYTGYYPNEIQNEINQLKEYKNIIIKFGRYKPGQQVHFDPIIGVSLANKEQYAEKIS